MSVAWFKKHWGLLALIAIGLAGGVLFWLTTTPWGIGVGYDSYFYLSAANNFLAGFDLSRFGGQGEVIPLTHFPPLYSLFLSFFAFITGLDTVTLARYLGLVFYAANIFLIGWLVRRYTRNVWVSIATTAFALLSPVLLDVHLMAMSEPPYLFVLLLTLYVLDEYLETGALRLLITAALLSSAAYLTRYIGLSVIALGFAALLLWRSGPLRRRVLDAAKFGFLVVIPVSTWLVRNWLQTGTLTNRSVNFHLPAASLLVQAKENMADWALPAGPPQLRTYVLLTGIIVMVLLAWRWRTHIRNFQYAAETRQSFRFAMLLALHIAIYLLLVFASLTLFDASTQLSDRILSPIYVSLLILIPILLWNGFLVGQPLWQQVFLFAVVLGLIWLNAIDYRSLARSMRQSGKGFTGRQWQKSDTIAALEELPLTTLIYSNEALPVRFLTNRHAAPIPENFDPVRGQVNVTFSTQIDLMKEILIQEKGALVIFDNIFEHEVDLPIEEISASLTLWRDTADGIIFVTPGFSP
jgi:hypothetical protein